MLRILRATAARNTRTFSTTRKLSTAAILPTTAAKGAPCAHPFSGAPFHFLRTFSSSDSSHQHHDDHSPSTSELSTSVIPDKKLDNDAQVSSSEISDAALDDALDIHQGDLNKTLKTQQLSEDSEFPRSSIEEAEALPASESVNADEDEEDEALSKSHSVNGDESEESEFVSASDSAYVDEDEGECNDGPGEDSTPNFVADSEEDCAIDMSKVPDDLKEMMEDTYVCESAEEDFTSEGPIELLTLDEVKQVLEDVRARDAKIFSVQDRCEWTDLMVIATGISDRHVRGIADALVYKIKKKGIVESPLYPTIEGQAGGKWLVVDCGNIVIHVLDEESRAYYGLEDLWSGEIRPSTADEDFETMLNQAGLKDVVP